MLESTVLSEKQNLLKNKQKFLEITVDSELPIRDQTTDKFRDTQEIRSRILEAFLYVRPGNGVSVKMAEAINRKVGQFLDDDVKIEDLGLKSLEQTSEFYNRLNLTIRRNYPRLLTY